VKRIVLFVAIALSSLGAAAQTCTPGYGVTCTPNLNMMLPPYNYLNWNVPMNMNFTILDTFSATLPKLNMMNTWTATQTFPNLVISSLAPGTGSICPNGPGGSLTQLGCSGGGGGGGTTTFPLTINNSGSGAASGSTFNGGVGVTISYNSIGASPVWTLTTTGTSGAATYSGGVLNIPQYAFTQVYPPAGVAVSNGSAWQTAYFNTPSANLMNSAVGATTALTYSGGQDSAAGSSNLGGVVVRGANNTGSTGSGDAGGAYIRGGDNSSTTTTSQSGSVEIEPGFSTAGGQQGVLIFGQAFTEGTGSFMQWGLVCASLTLPQVADQCSASPSNFLGVEDFHSGSFVQVHTPPSMSPIQASAAVTLGHTVCAGTTQSMVTDSGGQGACTTGITVGQVIAVSGQLTLADGSSAALSTTLPLVQMWTTGSTGIGDLTAGNSIGTSGIKVPLLSTQNTWTTHQFSGGMWQANGVGPALDATDGTKILYTTGAGWVAVGASDTLHFGSGNLTAGGLPSVDFGGFDATGHFSLTTVASSTSPICPNGTGGALTTTGCATGGTANGVQGSASTTNVLVQGGQDASSSSVLGGITVRGANNSGTGGGGNAGIGPGSGPTPGLFEEWQTFTSGGSTAWTLQCYTSTTTMTVADCTSAIPYNFVGVATSTATNGTPVMVAMGFSIVPINATAAVAVGQVVCASGTAGKVTGVTAGSVCSSGLGIGRVVQAASTPTYGSYPDGSSLPTISTTLPLVLLQPNYTGPYWQGAVGSSAIPKASTGGALVASSITDLGIDVVTTEPLYSVNGNQLTGTSATSIATLTYTTTGIAFPPTYATASRLYRGQCHVSWEQATGIATVKFGIGTSVAPTHLSLTSVSYPGTTSVPFGTGTTDTTTITTTDATGFLTPAGTATAYVTDIYVTASFTAAANTVTLYGQTSNTSDALLIEPGTFCTWIP